MNEVVSGRHNALVDPSLHIWGWEIPVYLFLGGLAAGLLVLSALLFLRGGRGRVASRAMQAAPFLALGVLSVGIVALFLDLEHKSHVFRFYLAFKPASPMSWGSWILLLVYPVGLLLGMASLDEKARDVVVRSRLVGTLRLGGLVHGLFARADAWAKGIARAAVATGASLGIYTGILLGALAAQPLWNSPVLGPLFLASGISSGGALLLLLPMSREEHRLVSRWDLWAIVTEMVLLALFLIGLAAGPRASQDGLRLLMSGPQASAFWVLVVLVGLVAPLTLKVIEHRRHLSPILVTPLLVLAGGFALRWILVVAGQASSLSPLF